MIAVVGLLLTTGGNDGLPNPSVGIDERLREARERLHLQRLWPESSELDVQLRTQAHLQASGGTPTANALQPTGASLDRTRLGGDAGSGIQEESPTRSSNLGAVQALICAYPWPQGCDYWIAVARCESGLRPSVYSSGGQYVGLFQVWTGHGYGEIWLLDPANNTLAAWELSHEGTYTGAWPWCQWQ